MTIFKRRETARCSECGHITFNGDPCKNGHAPDHRLRLSMREERALEYVRRGMPEGLFDPSYWPGVTPGDVRVARHFWRQWEPFHRLPESPSGKNALFE